MTAPKVQTGWLQAPMDILSDSHSTLHVSAWDPQTGRELLLAQVLWPEDNDHSGDTPTGFCGQTCLGAAFMGLQGKALHAAQTDLSGGSGGECVSRGTCILSLWPPTLTHPVVKTLQWH